MAKQFVKAVTITTAKLPDKPSQLLSVALADLTAAEKSPLYNVNMGIYHGGTEGVVVCSVCLAGAVMAFSLGVAREEETSPAGLRRDGSVQIRVDPHVEQKLQFVDNMRAGVFHSTDFTHPSNGDYWLVPMLKGMKPFKLNVSIPDYSDDRGGFKKGIRELISMFKAKGL